MHDASRRRYFTVVDKRRARKIGGEACRRRHFPGRELCEDGTGHCRIEQGHRNAAVQRAHGIRHPRTAMRSKGDHSVGDRDVAKIERRADIRSGNMPVAHRQ